MRVLDSVRAPSDLWLFLIFCLFVRMLLMLLRVGSLAVCCLWGVTVKGKTAGMVLIVRRENYTQEAVSRAFVPSSMLSL